MGTLEACRPAQLLFDGLLDRPLAVVGVTHAQSCLVLRGRLRALWDAGFRVVLISSPGVLADQLAAEEGAGQLSIPMERGIAPGADLVALVRLWMALRRLRPVLAEFSTPKAGFLGNVAAFLCGISTRVYMLRGLRLETASGLKRAMLRATEWIASACAHVVVCNSDSLLHQADLLGVAPRRKLRLIANGSSNGVDVERFVPGADEMRPMLGIPGDAPVIGFVGRLTRDKGIPELVGAFECLRKTLPSARLLLVGWVDQSEDALSADECARIDADPGIVCTGFVEDTAPYYRSMDVLVLPTWREGFPNVALEAAASGIPVITTLTTGARDAVVAGITGLLIPPGDPQELSDSMLGLLRDPVRRTAMGCEARRWVVQRFVNHRVLGLTVALYRELLHQAQGDALGAMPKDVAAVAD
jgi:glycosyltransferase involved in cell wall biosynthesis